MIYIKFKNNTHDIFISTIYFNLHNMKLLKNDL